MFGQIFTSYILQIIIQQELQKLTKILLKIFFKDINFPVKIIDTQKIEKKNSITNSVFCYKNKKKYLFYVSKNSCEKKNMLITDSRRRQSSFYYLQTLKDCFKINGKQSIKTPTKGEYFRFKNYERKIKSAFMIYPDLKSILVSEDNGK